MDLYKTLFNFLIRHDLGYVQGVIERYKKSENMDALESFIEKEKLQQETGLNILHIDNLVKYYKILEDRSMLDKIVGVGDDVSMESEGVADALYCMNTENFMLHFNEMFTDEQVANAIIDPYYHPVTGNAQ